VTVEEAAEILLEHLDGVPRARAELLDSSGIPHELWLPAIRALLGVGSAVKTGSKRGTRYLAGSYEFQPVRACETPQVAESYCGLVEKVLNDIALGTAYGGYEEGLDDAMDEGDHSLPDAEAEDDDEEDTDEVIGVLSMLRARGVSRIVDHRMRGGALWVIEGPGVEEAVSSVTQATGARFYYKTEGAKSTGWRSAWWTVAK
jgi:hypothetical protein